MSNAAVRYQPAEPRPARSGPEADAAPVDTTLLALVQAVSETTEDDREVVSTILHMIRSGTVRLRGIFRDEAPQDF